MPKSRTNIDCDLCVIGAGAGGLSVAAAAAAFGRHVVLIEKHKMGGDCLNYGCVPSKALLAAAKRAQAIRTANKFGITSAVPEISHVDVAAHVKSVIAAIAPNDSAERFTGLGVHVIRAAGRFVDKRTVTAGDYIIRARRFVIATGSSPFVPPIPGLQEQAYFTNETIFDNTERLPYLVVIGGGPIGIEMAQAHRRLGSDVTVVEGMSALGKDDPELAGVLLNKLREEGIKIHEHANVTKVEFNLFGGARVFFERDGKVETVDGSHILVATGRKPNFSDLNLNAAGVKANREGIIVNDGLVTSNKRLFAIGDVAGGPQFTHIANDDAGIVIRRALFRLPAKTSKRIIPWVTYTDPELAQVGMTESQAVEKYGDVKVLRWPYHENDRAQAERTTCGHIKVLTDKSGRILGATIVGAQAGELIQMWCLALSRKLKIRDMMGWISPYPTLTEINKRVAYRYYATSPTSPFVRKIIAFLAKFG